MHLRKIIAFSPEIQPRLVPSGKKQGQELVVEKKTPNLLIAC